MNNNGFIKNPRDNSFGLIRYQLWNLQIEMLWKFSDDGLKVLEVKTLKHQSIISFPVKLAVTLSQYPYTEKTPEWKGRKDRVKWIFHSITSNLTIMYEKYQTNLETISSCWKTMKLTTKKILTRSSIHHIDPIVRYLVCFHTFT